MARTTLRRAFTALALAGTLATGAAGAAAAQSSSDSLSSDSLSSSSLEEPSSEALAAGAASVACQYVPRELLESCGNLEPLTRDDPVALKLNPFTTNIVVLGAGLYPDGGIQPVLEQRLQTALRLARSYPTAPIIVTGGVPRNGRTEAGAMRDWLVGAGVDARRITMEDASVNTIQNAQFSGRILMDRGATAAVLVTNDFHLKRAMLNFRQVVGDRMPVTGVVA